MIIALEDMSFYAYHGYYAEEQSVGQNYTLSVYLDCKVHIDGSDELSDTYNYEWIYEICQDQMNIPRKLLETVCFHVAKALKAKSNLLQSGKIIIKKEGVALGGKVGRSVVEYDF